MNDLSMLLEGLDYLVTGIVVPFLVSLGACLARVALCGWKSLKDFAANFIIAFTLGMGANWLMLDMDIGGSTRAAITLGVALISKDWLDTIFSRRTRKALQERIAYEIGNRFRDGRPREDMPWRPMPDPAEPGRDWRADLAEPGRDCQVEPLAGPGRQEARPDREERG